MFFRFILSIQLIEKLMQSIVIAAPQSGSGKTTITLGIMAFLKRRGLRVAPFKVGPDFIDPGWHRAVTGRPSINLDGWMCSEEFVREAFVLHAQDSDIAVIEGVMGLFDGMDGRTDAGSTAQAAKILDAPVILVVDAKSQARSAAALVNGFACFDPKVHVIGVIFNNVGSENHARILTEAVETSCTGIRVLGCIPHDERLTIPSRHLGLVTADDNALAGDFQKHLAETIEKHVGLDGILTSGGQVSTFHSGTVKCGDLTPPPANSANPVRIAVARDEAFCFVYEDNLRLLREAGVEICEFSPMRDSSLPEGIGGIYLPGGYPELHADTLASNDSMKTAIREAIESGMPVYAECGGFIYLTRGQDIISPPPQPLSPGERVAEGGVRGHEFVGIFPITTRMLPQRKALGYREVEFLADSPIGRQGTVARGHEFHYSEMEEMPKQVEQVYRLSRNGSELGSEGYRYKNCLASYVHLHFGSCPQIAATFAGNCRIFITKP
jgi:cobyrinic acid a,c-diamide synthase